MPKTTLRNAAGDRWTITLDMGEIAGLTDFDAPEADLKPLDKLKKLKALFVPGLNEQFDDWKAELARLKTALPKCRVATAE